MCIGHSKVSFIAVIDIRAALFTATIQSPYTVIIWTALVTSQIRGKWLTSKEIKGRYQGYKFFAVIKNGLINKEFLIFYHKKICFALSDIFFHI